MDYWKIISTGVVLTVGVVTAVYWLWRNSVRTPGGGSTQETKDEKPTGEDVPVTEVETLPPKEVPMVHEVKPVGQDVPIVPEGEQDYEDSHNTQVEKSTGPSKMEGHIMLSYQWDVQKRVEQVYDALVQSGYSVWMDKQGDMSGNMNTAMAKAVEQANVVVCFMSQKYKDSHNCRLELCYANDCRKQIVPCMVEEKRGWGATDWLGLITAGLLWTDFRQKTSFEESIRQLKAEILGVLHGKNKDPKTDTASKGEVESSVQQATSQHHRFKNPRYVNWLVAGEALLMLQEASTDFLSKTLRKVHQAIVEKIGDKACSRVECTGKNVIHEINNITKTVTWRMKHKCEICDQWIHQLTALHRSGNNINSIDYIKKSWKNISFSDLPSKYWEFGKFFTGATQSADNTGPESTDLSGTMNIMVNLTKFSRQKSFQDQLKKVQEGRNSIMHSAKMELSTEKKHDIIKSVLDLLNNQDLGVGDEGCRQWEEKVLKMKDDKFNQTVESLRREVQLTQGMVMDLKQMLTNTEKQSDLEKVTSADIDDKLKVIQDILQDNPDLQEKLTSKLREDARVPASSFKTKLKKHTRDNVITPHLDDLEEEGIPFCSFWSNLDIIEGKVELPTEDTQWKCANMIRQGKTVHPHEIFESKSEDNSSILICANAAFGKTHLVNQMLKDWVEGVAYKDVPLMFSIILRQLNDLKDKEMTIFDLLADFCSPPGTTAEEVKQAIKEHNKTVILIDGLDEFQKDLTDKNIPPVHNEDAPHALYIVLANLLWKNILKEITFVLTSRNHAAIGISCKRKMEILGFSSKQITEFVEKFSGVNDAVKEFIEKYLDACRAARGLCYVPGFLMFLCWALKIKQEEGGNDNESLPKNWCELTCLMECEFLRKFLTLTHKETNLSDADVWEKCLPQINAFCKIGLQGMIDGHMIFDVKALPKPTPEFQGTGIMVSTTTRRYRRVKKTVNFVHLSYQEKYGGIALARANAGELEDLLKKPITGRLKNMLASMLAYLANYTNEGLNTYAEVVLKRKNPCEHEPPTAQPGDDAARVIADLKNALVSEGLLIYECIDRLVSACESAFVRENIKAHEATRMSAVLRSAYDELYELELEELPPNLDRIDRALKKWMKKIVEIPSLTSALGIERSTKMIDVDLTQLAIHLFRRVQKDIGEKYDDEHEGGNDSAALEFSLTLVNEARNELVTRGFAEVFSKGEGRIELGVKTPEHLSALTTVLSAAREGKVAIKLEIKMEMEKTLRDTVENHIDAIGQNLHLIEELQLDGCELDMEECEKFLKNLDDNTTMKTLRFYQDNPDIEVIGLLWEIRRRQAETPQPLTININRGVFRFEGMTRKQRATTKTSIDVICSNLHMMTELKFEHCELTTEEWHTVIQHLSTNTTITDFGLEYNALTDEDLDFLKEHLMNNDTLWHISLQRNHFSREKSLRLEKELERSAKPRELEVYTGLQHTEEEKYSDGRAMCMCGLGQDATP